MLPNTEQPAAVAIAGTEDGLTDLLARWRREGVLGETLASRIYPLLRKIAANRGQAIAMDTTELVHEAFIQLFRQRSKAWRNRSQFFSVAARLIRRVVIDHVREQRAQKRHAPNGAVALDELRLQAPERHPDLLDLDRALDELSSVDDQLVRVVEMRYIVGLTVDETAHALDMGRTSVVRYWRYASAWLRERLGS